MKLFELRLRLIALLFVLCCFVFFGSQVAEAQGLWLGNDTVGDVFRTTTSGAVITDLPSLSTTGIAWDGSHLYFADPAGNFTKRTADGKTVLESFAILSPGGGEDLAWDSKRNVLWRILHSTNVPQKIDPAAHTVSMSYAIPPHPIQANRQTASHRYLNNALVSTHRQVNIPTSPVGMDTRRRLGRLHQQEAQQGVALLAD